MADEDKNISRRDFLISLGGGALAVAGTYVAGRIPAGVTGPSVSRPRLRGDVVISAQGDRTTFSRGLGDARVEVTVNGPATFIATRLDGTRDAIDLARDVAGKYSLRADEALAAEIAVYLAQLGMLSLLEEPYYARIFATGEVAG